MLKSLSGILRVDGDAMVLWRNMEICLWSDSNDEIALELLPV